MFSILTLSFAKIIFQLKKLFLLSLFCICAILRFEFEKFHYFLEIRERFQHFLISVCVNIENPSNVQNNKISLELRILLTTQRETNEE